MGGDNIMCGRYALFTGEEYEEIRAIIKETQNNNIDNINNMKTGEIFPTDIVPVITKGDTNDPTFNLFKWGFPNFIKKSGVIINARGETIEEKQTFKNILYTKRCLIPTCGFFEWKKSDKNKDKIFIKPEGSNIFYMAGLYNSFIDNAGIPYTSFVIITTQASQEMQFIHDRMPLILSSKIEAYEWIDNPKKLSEIKSFIQPFKHKLSLENLCDYEQKQLKFEM